MIEVTAFCPCCGAYLVGTTNITGVRMDGESNVIVLLNATVYVKHKCKKQPQDS